MIEEAIEFASDWQAFWLLVEWFIFIGLVVIGVLAWLLLQVLNKN